MEITLGVQNNYVIIFLQELQPLNRLYRLSPFAKYDSATSGRHWPPLAIAIIQDKNKNFMDLTCIIFAGLETPPQKMTSTFQLDHQDP